LLQNLPKVLLQILPNIFSTQNHNLLIYYSINQTHTCIGEKGINNLKNPDFLQVFKK